MREIAKIILLEKITFATSLGGKNNVNLKYERLWTDILPRDLNIWGDGKYNYKTDFRKKYIGLFIVLMLMNLTPTKMLLSFHFLYESMLRSIKKIFQFL